jgi:hypothetical protein
MGGELPWRCLCGLKVDEMTKMSRINSGGRSRIPVFLTSEGHGRL